MIYVILVLFLVSLFCNIIMLRFIREEVWIEKEQKNLTQIMEDMKDDIERVQNGD